MRELVDCPVPGCVDAAGKPKRFKNLIAHLRNSHPDVDPRQYSGVAPEPPAKPPAAAASSPDAASPPAGGPDPLQAAVESALAPLTHVISSQQGQIAELHGKLAQQQQETAEFQKSVLDGFNTIPQIVKRSVTEQLTQVIAEAQSSQGGNVPEAGGEAALAQGAGTSGNPRSDLIGQFVPLLLKEILGTGKPAPGGDLMQQISLLKNIAEAFNPLPNILAGMNMATTMFTAASRAGISPEDAAKGSQELLDRMTPRPPTGQRG